MITRGFALLVAVTLLAHSTQVGATGVNEIPFEKQVSEADLVVIAGVVRIKKFDRRRLDASGQLELQRMKILRTLKGRANKMSFELVTRGEVAELSLDCCDSRKSYLLLLKRGRNNIYEAVNGRFSVIVLP